MQIDRFNHLQFPRDNTAAQTGKDGAANPLAPGLNKAAAKALPVQAQAPTARAGGVVLKIQFPEGTATDAVRTPGDVYAPARPVVARSDADADNQAIDHQRALERNAGTFTPMSISKDGVLVARPAQPLQSAPETQQPDFVALAVSAMREFSDAAEREKVRVFDLHQAPPEQAHGKFKGLQQLAARFNVFA